MKAVERLSRPERTGSLTVKNTGADIYDSVSERLMEPVLKTGGR